jgi:hypothetical protein
MHDDNIRGRSGACTRPLHSCQPELDGTVPCLAARHHPCPLPSPFLGLRLQLFHPFCAPPQEWKCRMEEEGVDGWMLMT